MPDLEADYEIDFTPDERKILDGIRHQQPAPAYAPPPLTAQEDPATDRELAGLQLQAAASAAREQGQEPAEGTIVTDENSVELLGKRFRIAKSIGLMPLLKFSAAADMRTDDPQALSAMYSMLMDCIERGTPGCGKCTACKAGDEQSCPQYEEGDWGAFERHAIDTKAEAEDLLDVIQEVMSKLAGRPKEPRAGSSRGQRAISGGSTARSSARRGKGSRR